jgi:hypothetical protein
MTHDQEPVVAMDHVLKTSNKHPPTINNCSLSAGGVRRLNNLSKFRVKYVKIKRLPNLFGTGSCRQPGGLPCPITFLKRAVFSTFSKENFSPIQV